MSLTNPDHVVTEERLSQFYQGILPYLGGNAGKGSNFPLIFDERNNEYQAGWYFNSQGLKKPIYQKSFTGTATGNNSTWVDIGDTTTLLPNYDKVLNYDGFTLMVSEYSGGRGILNVYLSDSNDFLIQQTTTSHNLTWDYYVTIQYTKTTDTYISADAEYPVKYSTDERVIGQWIDGKPVYQKTLSFTTSSSSDTNINHNISNVDMILSFDGFIIDSNIFKPFGFYSPYGFLSIFITTTQLNIRAGSSSEFNKPGYITIRYTKTTD